MWIGEILIDKSSPPTLITHGSRTTASVFRNECYFLFYFNCRHIRFSTKLNLSLSFSICTVINTGAISLNSEDQFSQWILKINFLNQRIVNASWNALVPLFRFFNFQRKILLFFFRVFLLRFSVSNRRPYLFLFGKKCWLCFLATLIISPPFCPHLYPHQNTDYPNILSVNNCHIQISWVP